MAKGFIIFAVFATMMQTGSFASSSAEGSVSLSDVLLARNKTSELWTLAMETLFDAIEGTSTSDDAKDKYITYSLEGGDYYLKILQSVSEDYNVTGDQYINKFKNVTDNVFEGIRLARSSNLTLSETLTEINAIEAAIQVDGIATPFLDVSENSESTSSTTEALADIKTVYENIFGGIESQAKLNYGIIEEVYPSYESAAILAVTAASEDIYQQIIILNNL